MRPGTQKTKDFPGISIGKPIKITNSNDQKLIGKKGVVLQETKNTFSIRTKEKQIKVLKHNNTFEINNKEIKGNNILKRPEEQLKEKK